MSSWYSRVDLPSHATVASVALCALAWANACGGKAVIDGPTGGGGEGGAPVTTTSSTTATITTTPTTEPPPTSTSTTTTTDVSDCETACTVLWDCMQQDDLCPGIDPSMGDVFVPYCLETCAQTPALIALVNPDDCATTIQTLTGVSPEFDEICSGTY
jgi:hypothetical protein